MIRSSSLTPPLDALPKNASPQNHSLPNRAKIEIEMALYQPIPALL